MSATLNIETTKTTKERILQTIKRDIIPLLILYYNIIYIITQCQFLIKIIII